MNTHVVHRLVGYDRQTERVAVECEIPSDKWAAVKSIAFVQPTDPEAYDAYFLDPYQVGDISFVIGRNIDADKYDYFLEAFADPDEARRFA